MVNKIVNNCINTNDQIACLRIVGHGNARGQYIGRDWVSEQNLGKYQDMLEQLNSLFDIDLGEVIMGGCQQGQNGAFLLALSNIWGVPVSGFTAMQRPLIPGDEGSRTTCFITCRRSAETGWDEFDEGVAALVDAIQRLQERLHRHSR